MSLIVYYLITKHDMPAHVALHSCVFMCTVIAFFLVVLYFIVRSVRKTRLSTLNLAGGKSRQMFLLVLCLANAARAVSLAVYLYLHVKSLGGWTNDNGSIEGDVNDTSFDSNKLFSSFLQSVIIGFPALIFVTAYSIVVLFWAQVR